MGIMASAVQTSLGSRRESYLVTPRPSLPSTGRFDRFAGRLGRESHRLIFERINSAASFGGRLIHKRHLDEARNDELAGFAQFPVGLSAGPSKASSIYSAMMLDSRMRRPS